MPHTPLESLGLITVPMEPPALYLNAQGKIPQFECVRQATAALRESEGARNAADEATYVDAVGGLVFGESRECQDAKRFVTHQALSGTHALTLGARLLSGTTSRRRVYLPMPSWSNHQRIFERAGFQVAHYPYFNAQTRELDIGSLVGFLCRLPEPGVIVLQASCHNPTGSDLTQDQWDTIADVMKALGHTPFIDMAYQGLGEGEQVDNYGITAMVRRGVFTLVAQSCSKIFQLAGARCGSLSIYCPSTHDAQALHHTINTLNLSQGTPLTSTGMPIVARILSQPSLRRLWQEELLGVRDRISMMRIALHRTLCRMAPAWDWSYLTHQRGYFSYDPALHAPSTAGSSSPGSSDHLVVSPSGRLGISLITESTLPDIAHFIARASTP